MKTNNARFLPEARREGIIAKEFEGELLVYDTARDKAHCLNPLARAIWKQCDGRTTAAEIAGTLSAVQSAQSVASQGGKTNASTEVDERVVWLGLQELRRSHLLEDSIENEHWPHAIAGMTRREAIRRIGLGAAITLPIVVSMSAPTAVQAAVSCGQTCKPCNTSADCCGACLPGPVAGCPGTNPRCS